MDSAWRAASQDEILTILAEVDWLEKALLNRGVSADSARFTLGAGTQGGWSDVEHLGFLFYEGVLPVTHDHRGPLATTILIVNSVLVEVGGVWVVRRAATAPAAACGARIDGWILPADPKMLLRVPLCDDLLEQEKDLGDVLQELTEPAATGQSLSARHLADRLRTWRIGEPAGSV